MAVADKTFKTLVCPHSSRSEHITAFGSCQETMAALELAEVFGYTEDASEPHGRFDRVAAMLYRLTT